VHELSIAQSLVSLVQQQLPEGVTRVTAVDMRLGALAGVVRGALEFCYDIATEGTPLQGSISELPSFPSSSTAPSARWTRRWRAWLSDARCAGR
jgi:hydrogenase nickel incorporation protein HypA/HybF